MINNVDHLFSKTNVFFILYSSKNLYLYFPVIHLFILETKPIRSDLPDNLPCEIQQIMYDSEYNT